jgi:hypothetical protein
VTPRSVYFLCALFAALSITVTGFSQPSLTAEGGLGWDGSQYARLTGQCWRRPLDAHEPFTYRIGTPCLAALVPAATPKDALRLTNIASGTLLLFLLATWLMRFMPPIVVASLLAVFAFHWVTPLRYSWWYPTYIEPPGLCAIVGALLLRQRPVALAIVCAFGVMVRESVMAVPFALVAGRLITLTDGVRTLEVRRIAADALFRSAVAALIVSLAAFGATHVLSTPTSDYWIADSSVFWFYSKPFPEYVLAWFVAFGPMIVLPFVRPKPVLRFFADTPEYAVMLFAFAVLSWIGGTDTERFLLWGTPIVLAAVGVAAADIEWRSARVPLALLAIGHVLNGRWFLVTPIMTVDAPREWPILTTINAHRFEDLVSLTPDRPVSAAMLAEYLVLALIVGLWLRPRRAAPLQPEDVVARNAL